MGRSLPALFPNGRVNSDGGGGATKAIIDRDEIATLNKIPPLGEMLLSSKDALRVFTAKMFGTPITIGNGWSYSYNWKSGYNNFSHTSGLNYRFDIDGNKTRIDIPAGFSVPSGRLSVSETVHYEGQ